VGVPIRLTVSWLRVGGVRCANSRSKKRTCSDAGYRHRVGTRRLEPSTDRDALCGVVRATIGPPDVEMPPESAPESWWPPWLVDQLVKVVRQTGVIVQVHDAGAGYV
jgi:hypothetical protein